MQANYKTFITRVISRYEGDYCWDAGDSGGPTKFGITCYDLAEHMGRKMTSMARVGADRARNVARDGREHLR